MKKLVAILALALSLPIYAQELNDGLLTPSNWFVGSTLYRETNVPITLNWEPHADNASWQGNYVFDLDVVAFERDNIVLSERALNTTQYQFNLPSAGHYWVRLRTCLAEDTAVCSEWSSSWNAQFVADSTSINGFWIFARLAAPSGPGVR